MKGSDLSVARVTMVDYMNEEAADEFEAADREICPQILPEADALILLRTSGTSGLRIAIYKSEDLAEKMLPTRAKMLEQCFFKTQNIFHFEVSVGLQYVNKQLLENKTT